ncbi:MAG: DUF6110 family protein [Muricomes sp.]
MMNIFNMKKIGIFAGGVLFGTAGVKILSSRDAKKAYTNCTAAVLRAKDCVMKTASSVQENAEDILAEAKQINEERVKCEEVQAEDSPADVENFEEE